MTSNDERSALSTLTLDRYWAWPAVIWKRTLTKRTSAFGQAVWPVVVTLGVGLVAYTDWRVVDNVSVGYLYLVPLVLAANTIRPRKWLLGFVLLAAVLREVFGPFQHSGWTMVARSVIVPSVYAFVVLFVHRFSERQRTLAGLIEQQHRRLSRDLEEAAAVQRLLIPHRLPDVPGWQVAARLSPARVVSGDFFDVRWNDARQQLTLVIADVGGKGAGAAMLMPVVQSTVRRLQAEGHAPDVLASKLNGVVAELTDRPRLVSLVFATLETATGALSYVNLGHPPPLVAQGSSPSASRWLSEGGPISGVSPHAEYQVGREMLDAGDVLIFYTDGATESENARGEPFAAEGIVNVACEHADQGADDILDSLQAAVEGFCADPATRDDMTLIVVRRPPSC